jgi:hypothetical protein
MGAPTPVIVKVDTPVYGTVAIEASDGLRYFANLEAFAGVYCFPRSKPEWDRVARDSYGLGLIWETRFEIHIDQILALAFRREPISQSA